MAPLLILHIAAGSVAIHSGATALCVRKGGGLHRASGRVFALSMMTMAALGAWLAIGSPKGAPAGAPPRASATIAVLTFYLVATGWMSVRRKTGGARLADYAALMTALGVVAALLLFGVEAARAPGAVAGDYAPYFVFCAIAAIPAALDLRMIRRGGLQRSERVARHLWRMCLALFFASAFFFVGQQKVFPAALRGGPVLLAPAFAPLVLMMFWVWRVRFRRTSHSGPTT